MLEAPDLRLLDDPAWHALTGPHRRFTVAPGSVIDSARAYRYRVDVGPFAALRDSNDPAGWHALAALSNPGDRAALVGPSARPPVPAAAGWQVTDLLSCAQMLAPADGVIADMSMDTPVTLGPRDAAEMVALAELTHPGPFATSTVELGGYLGVRRDGRLIAMAGRRLQLPGWIEISAVCTHPDHRGQGLAGLLIAAVDEGIRQHNHRAFLHVVHQNTSAIQLYRQLGFTARADMTFTVVQLANA